MWWNQLLSMFGKLYKFFSGKDYLLVECDSMDSLKNTSWSYDVGGEKVWVLSEFAQT